MAGRLVRMGVVILALAVIGAACVGGKAEDDRQCR